MIPDPAAFLRQLFDRAVEVADPMALARPLPAEKPKVASSSSGREKPRPHGRSGRAEWGLRLVITRYGYGRPCEGIGIVEAAHPVPDPGRGRYHRTNARALDGLTERYRPRPHLWQRLHLLCAPAAGMTLAEKQAVNAALYASGAPISAMNTVRKHLSRVKGGQLAAAAYPARLLALMISDVPGDDPAFIGSGPTVGDATTPATSAPPRPLANPRPCLCPRGPRTIRCRPPGDLRLFPHRKSPLRRPRPIPRRCHRSGCALQPGPRTLGDNLEGEAREVARALGSRPRHRHCRKSEARRPPRPPPLRRRVDRDPHRRRGRGPNAEFCLALALALDGHPQMHARWPATPTASTEPPRSRVP